LLLLEPNITCTKADIIIPGICPIKKLGNRLAISTTYFGFAGSLCCCNITNINDAIAHNAAIASANAINAFKFIFYHLFLDFFDNCKRNKKFDIEGMGCIFYTKSQFSKTEELFACGNFYANIQAVAPPRNSNSKATSFISPAIGSNIVINDWFVFLVESAWFLWSSLLV
jgi:hypothetical protein